MAKLAAMLRQINRINLLFIVALILICHAVSGQFINVKYSQYGKTHNYPFLKKDGNSFIPNMKEKDITWNEFQPFYVQENGDLVDANRVKIGEWNGSDFSLLEGSATVDNRQISYRHKEMIYDPNEITIRYCNGQRMWFRKLSDGHTYQQFYEDRSTVPATKKEGELRFELVNLTMTKQIAAAFFWRMKIVQNDIAPCGFGEHDDRGQLFSDVTANKENVRPTTDQVNGDGEYVSINAQQEEIARDRIFKEMLAKGQITQEGIERAKAELDRRGNNEKDNRTDGNIAVNNNGVADTLGYSSKIQSIKLLPLSDGELLFVGNWEFASEKMTGDYYINDPNTYQFFEEFNMHADRTYEYKSYVINSKIVNGSQEQRSSPLNVYNEKGIWQLKDNILTEYILEENGKFSKRSDWVKFDAISKRKAERTAAVLKKGIQTKISGKKM